LNSSVENFDFPVDFSNSPVEDLIWPVSSLEFPGYETCRTLNVPGDRLRSAGKTTGEMVQMWNEDYAEDMIIFSPEPEPQSAQADSSLALSMTVRTCRVEPSSYWPGP
jgi:hypothetical protein